MKPASSFVPRARIIFVPWIVIAAVSGIAIASAAADQPMPAQAKFRGKSVAEWGFLQSEWLIATGLGGQSLPDTVQKMRFLPGPFGPGNAEFDIVVPSGTGLVSSPFFVFGERYEDGTEDNPNDPFLASLLDTIFKETRIDVSLDGGLVLSGTPAELSDYTYGFTDAPLFFDEPIVYEDPIDRGGIFAVAALWTAGMGAVYHSLPPGEHTLEVLQDSPVFGFFDTTYHIRVQTLGVKNVPEPAALVLLLLTAAGMSLGRRSKTLPVSKLVRA